MIEPKLIIDYRERHPNLRALSDSGAVLSAIREKYSAYFPIFPSKPSPSAIAGGPSSQLWHFSPKTQVIEGEILRPVAKKKLPNVVPKAPILPKPCQKLDIHRHRNGLCCCCCKFCIQSHPILPIHPLPGKPVTSRKWKQSISRGNFVSGQLRKSSLEKTHKGQQRSKSPKEINFSAWKTSKRGRLQYFPQRFPAIRDPEQVSPSVPRALDEWEHYLGINGEWSTMIPTNAFNGEIPSKYKCSQWRRHEGRDARAICPSLILACFQFIPEISSVSNGENNVFPKYVFFYVMYLYFLWKSHFTCSFRFSLSNIWIWSVPNLDTMSTFICRLHICNVAHAFDRNTKTLKNIYILWLWP